MYLVDWSKITSQLLFLLWVDKDAHIVMVRDISNEQRLLAQRHQTLLQCRYLKKGCEKINTQMHQALHHFYYLSYTITIFAFPTVLPE